jgi:hypothetical protein
MRAMSDLVEVFHRPEPQPVHGLFLCPLGVLMLKGHDIWEGHETRFVCVKLVLEECLGPKRTVEYEGKSVIAQALKFDAASEPWNHYTLEDGSVLKLKVILLDVVRLEGVYNNGMPVYQFAAQQVLSVDSPEELKEKK